MWLRSSNPRSLATKLCLVNLFVLLITARYSIAYFHLDEHCQILDFLGYKLGLLDARHLPWEYHWRMRPWLQVSIYFGIAKLAFLGGVRDIFALTWILRTVSALISWVALTIWTRATMEWFSDARHKRMFLYLATLTGFLPYFMARTSSENLSGSAMTVGAAVLLHGLKPSCQIAERQVTVARALAGGILFGLGFEFRFQSAILAFGLVAWLFWVRALNARAFGCMLVGGIAVMGLATVVDFWGYGRWSFPPLAYLRANLQVANRYGVHPFLGYFYLPLSNIFAPIIAIYLAFLLLLWAFAPRHALTWITFPFFAIHAFIAHKEERFLLPMVWFVVAAPAVVMSLESPRLEALRRAGSALWRWLRRPLFVWNFAAMAFLAVYPLGWNHHVPFHAFLRHQFPQGFSAYVLEPPKPFGLAPLYAPRPQEITETTPDALLKERGTVYVFAPLPSLDSAELAPRATLIYSELPFFEHTGFRNRALRAVRFYNALPQFIRPDQVWWLSVYRIEPQ